MGSLPDLSMTLVPDNDKFQEFKQKLVFIGYRIYILNYVPKVQINLDLYINARYAISNQQKAGVEHLLTDKQEILQQEKELTKDDRGNLDKINEQINDIYGEVAKKIIGEDFKYIIEETVTNWLDTYAPKK